MKKLILIEGLPGSGKSTTAQWLHHSFCQSKISSQWFYELSENHPLTYSSDIRKISGDQLLKEGVDRWERFILSEMNGYETTIIDSGFFQKNIMYMLNLNIDKDDIQKYAMQVEALISKYDTYFIYLNSDDADRHMLRTYRIRGKRFQDTLIKWSNNTDYSVSNGYQGLEGSLAYWRDYSDLCDRIYERFRFKKVEMDLARGGWPERYVTLSRFLDIGNYDSTNSVSILHGKLSGDYLVRGSDTTVKITEQSGRFSITNLLHALEAKSLMIPNSSNNFFIRGHDVSLRFEEFRRGVPAVMKVSSSWNKIDGGIFERIAQ